MNKKKTTGLRIPLHQAEQIRIVLLRKKLINQDLKIKKDKEFIYLPIKHRTKDIDNFTTIETTFEKRKVKPKSYKEIISISSNLKNELPTAYDIIGDIIVIKLPQQLLPYKTEIGKSLLISNRNIKTVCITEPISGEFRTRSVQVIAGENRTTTTHKEYGLTFDLDINKNYFSPRLATERKRIVNLVQPNEVIIDMFTGVAPFSIMIAKFGSPKIIYAIDKNKDAVYFAKKNIKKNNVLDKIEILHADAKKISSKFKDRANRVIMNLPFSAYEFFTDALKISKNNTIIHYYDIVKQNNIQNRIDILKNMAHNEKYILSKIDIKKIKTYAPREFYIRMDITAKKMPM
jgi:tRNA (guanine37-N1)-methyltransferase